MARTSLPVLRGLFLSLGTTFRERAQLDLLAVFNTLTIQEFPCSLDEFFVTSQLTDGRGRMAFGADVIEAETDELIHRTSPHEVNFPTPLQVVKLVIHVREIVFPRPGVYFLELNCDNQVIADTRMILRSR